MRFSTLAFSGIFAVIVFCLPAVAKEIDFSRDIRPILSENCFLCHGPDDSSREADLRLDVREEAIAAGAIAEGKWLESSLLERIKSDDSDKKMPPEGSNKHLKPEQIELIQQWLEQGAKYSQHWAFVPPTRPEVPVGLGNSDAPIDAFVAKKLHDLGLSSTPKADRATLLRRIYLDLVGLPPTPAEIDQFLKDDSAKAFESAVDRLLQSPHYGEKWARWWLDAGRYADSDGYEKDKPRDVWFYRDWVIRSLNEDMPYDQFVIKQIAGDLLPNATQDDRVATGFLRNSMVNEEGGADPEQFRVEGMFDRVDAIGKAVLGLTTQCAQCHTHKYDPLTQTEYYAMFAALNDFHEAIETVYTPEQYQQIDRIKSQVSAIETQVKQAHPDWANQMANWREQVAAQLPKWTTLKPTSLPFDGQKFRMLPDNSIVSESYAPTHTSVSLPCDVVADQTDTKTITSIRLDVLTHPQLPHNGPGRSIYGTGALTEFETKVSSKDGSFEPYNVKFVRAYADVSADRETLRACFRNRDAAKDDRVTGPIIYAIDGDAKTAWTTDSGPATRNQDCHAIFIPEKPIEIGSGITLTISLNMNHGGWNSDDNQNYLLGRYRLSFSGDEVEKTAEIPSVVEPLLQTSGLDESQTAALFSYWRTQQKEAIESNQKIASLLEEFPEAYSQLTAQQMDKPRESFVFLRGDFLNHGEVVAPGSPQFLNAMKVDDEPSRLRFARWLVARDAPTSARVIVNRVWQSYFERGLVATSEDFGLQSAAPSHPQLLDWLAVEFMDSGWSLKHLHKLIVMSSTYQQSSNVSDHLAEVDPNNVWLARGPRGRVQAETVRDIALSVSGLLDNKIGGPSVYPPAPKFLFEPPASYGPKVWNVSTDGSQYRRSVYVHRFRSVLYPSLQVFDAPRGDTACVRRERSNTPLQALVMLNEPQFVEATRAFATRVLRDVPSTDRDRISYAHRLCTGRLPTDAEIAVLQKLVDLQRERIKNGELKSEELVGIADDMCQQLTGMTSAQIAPWIVLCKAVLNLDETISKG